MTLVLEQAAGAGLGVRTGVALSRELAESGAQPQSAPAPCHQYLAAAPGLSEDAANSILRINPV